MRTKKVEVLPYDRTWKLAFEEIKKETENRGGVCIAAHIDRDKNGIVAILGAIPESMNFTTLETADKNTAENADKRYKYITNSDAHYLTDISEKENFLEVEEITAECIINKLK